MRIHHRGHRGHREHRGGLAPEDRLGRGAVVHASPGRAGNRLELPATGGLTDGPNRNTETLLTTPAVGATLELRELALRTPGYLFLAVGGQLGGEFAQPAARFRTAGSCNTSWMQHAPFTQIRGATLRQTGAAVIFLSFFQIALTLHAGWIVTAGSPSLVYSARQGEGHDSLEDALQELSDSGRSRELDVITAHWLLQDDAFQQELFAGLEREVPGELAAARKSAGNMHNPKMLQLGKPFKRVLLTTPTITKLNASLAVHGLIISGVGVEKFELRSTLNDPRDRFHAFLWLNVTRLLPPSQAPIQPGNRQQPRNAAQ